VPEGGGPENPPKPPLAIGCGVQLGNLATDSARGSAMGSAGWTTFVISWCGNYDSWCKGKVMRTAKLVEKCVSKGLYVDRWFFENFRTFRKRM